ncbi:pyridoxal-phosphate dependent enzyme [Paludibacter sp. 221]|uniref:threonine synthase n=1 Tax=Paludibacter sp. 221 TaxID=2302939 RepID=UPI0013D7A796|nr:pyridoxal-phosphate dependent enzyme [Paludibacter sp. 221]NDV46908.1 pyridoxal-phosphate dependent enzyme [Paludibacter sp. 221]
MSKYYLKCVQCGYITPDFKTWFSQNQICPKCGSKHSEVWYNTDYKKLDELIKHYPDSFWHYFDFLPLESDNNIVSRHEGAIPIEQWSFLEKYAQEKYGLDIKVFAYRNDLNGGTGTFKDVAASLAASLFRENGVKQYCVASTGNTATAYGLYLSLADVNASIFIPNNALKASEAMISAYGQQVFRVNGDYAKAKAVAAEYAKKYNILISTGNIDPIRVEAKKTMIFEWMRQLKGMPDVYIQAVSGGTGPIAMDKGLREVSAVHPELKMPRMLLVQPDQCDPMVQAWEKAEKNGFPEGFENEYPTIKNPKTSVPTLATGEPATYPIVAKLVRKSNGTFVRMREDKLPDYGKLVAFERKIILGPASAVCIAGFFESLKKGLIKNGERVLLNTGEGVRRAPDYVNEMIYTTKKVECVDDCKPHDMNNYREMLWNAIED